MLREEGRNDISKDISQADADNFVCHIENEPVMRVAVDLIPKISKFEKIILKARGYSIPNAVAVANILTEKLLKGNSKIQKILVDSESPAGMGRMISTIEIIISKN